MGGRPGGRRPRGLPAHYRATVDVGAGLGLRQGEAFGLAAGDVDFLRVVHVRRQVRLVGGKLGFGPPKGGKERDVPLPGSVGVRLAEHIRGHPPVHTGGVSLIFTTPAAGPVNRNTYNTRWREALDAAGLPRERANGFHVLRHTFASALLADGVDVRALSEYLGHGDPGFTLRVYCHLMPSAPDRMRSAIDRALDGAPDVRAGILPG